jgi:hypothetical protein
MYLAGFGGLEHPYFLALCRNLALQITHGATNSSSCEKAMIHDQQF